MTSNSRHVLANGLRAGETRYGTFMMEATTVHARSVAMCGWDFVIVDCEHGNIDDGEMYNSVSGVASCGVSPIVRIAEPTVGSIKRALDTGAHGILVPMVSTADEARFIVQAAKFPPKGIRGQGSQFSSWASGLSVGDYVKQANDSILTIVQVENKAGLDNVEEIVAVDGVDGIFIGPNDLHLTLFNSVPADFSSPPYLEVLDRIFAACKSAGKPCGILMPDGKGANWAVKRWGSTLGMCALGGDVKGMMAWMQAEIKTAKA